MSESFVSQDENGVIVEVVVADDFMLAMNRWILVEDSEFEFILYSIKNKVASKTDYSAMLYDVKSVNGVPAVYIEWRWEEGADLFPIRTAEFICQCLIAAKYPGIDVNSFYTTSGSGVHIPIIIGTTEPIQFEESY